MMCSWTNCECSESSTLFVNRLADSYGLIVHRRKLKKKTLLGFFFTPGLKLQKKGCLQQLFREFGEELRESWMS